MHWKLWLRWTTGEFPKIEAQASQSPSSSWLQNRNKQRSEVCLPACLPGWLVLLFLSKCLCSLYNETWRNTTPLCTTVKTRTACSPLNRISFAIIFDPHVNLHYTPSQFLILCCLHLCHAKLFVSHLGWDLSATIMMKRLNLYVIPLIYSL